MKEIVAREAALSLIAEHTHDIVVCTDTTGLLRYVSPSVRDYGYRPEDLLGRHGGLTLHPEDAERVLANTQAILSGEPAAPFHQRQFRCRTADGGWIWVEGNPRAMRDEDGRIVGLVNVLRDITDRRAHADLFEAAFEHAAVGMALVDLDGSFMRTNEAFCQIVGHSSEALRRLDFQRITHPDDLDMDLDLLAKLRDGVIDSYRMDKRYVRADGGCVWVHLTVSMVRQACGAPKHYVAQAQDQSARRAAEAALTESEARYRLIAENTSDIITMSDLKGVTTYASPAVRRVGFEPSDLIGRTFTSQIHADDAPLVMRAFTGLQRGEAPKPVRWRGRHGRTGDWVWLESIPALLRDPATGAPVGYLDVIRDVSAQVAQETELAKAWASAEAAAAAKSQFLANMSHEIRTPLTAVLGFSGLLQQLEGLGEKAEGYVTRICGAGNGLLAIVNDILDFSKLEAGKFEIRPGPTDLKTACEETLELFAGQAHAKGLSLDFEPLDGAPRTVLVDGDRVRQALINLIGNAIKFTESGGVTLRVGPAAGGVVFEVCDTGVGLELDAQSRLFERFTQIDNTTTRLHGGTGLGLAICRGLAEAMGGTIEVESLLGFGSTFRLTLPAPAVDAARSDPPEAQPISIEGMRIFVVDDNAANRELARKVLEAGGAEVTEASDGLEAIRRLATAPVDVVLMDLRMPAMDGRAALAALRGAAGPNRDVPVLAFTADADVGGPDDLSGFDGLVRKPLQPLEMFDAIATATRRAGRARTDVAA